MCRTFFSFFAFIFVFTLSFSQNKLFTLEDVIRGGNNFNSLQATKLQNLVWLIDEDSYSYTDSIGLRIVKASNTKKVAALSMDELNEILQTKLRIFPVHTWSANRTLQIFLRNELFYIDVTNKKLLHSIDFPGNFRNTDFSPNDKKIAYTVGKNLFITDIHSNVHAITNDSLDGIVNGQSVHRNEFGITKGTFWSPNGESLAFYRKDETKVPIYKMLSYTGKLASVVNTRYTFAGGVSEQVQVGIFNTLTKQTTYLSTGLPKDRYFTNLSWSPDASILYVAELNRDQNHMQIKSYNAQTGDLIQVLFEEKRSTYVEPEHPLSFSPKNTSLFIWQSERSGHNHLYLYNTNGELQKQLTQGIWDVSNLLGWSKNGKEVFFVSTQISPLNRNVYKVNISTDKIIAINDTHGVHKGMLSASKKHLLDEWSAQNRPHITDLYTFSNTQIKEAEIQKAQNPYAEYLLGETEVFTIKSTDQTTDLYARMIKPIHFDPTKKYPVIVYVYGGPHSQQITNNWMAKTRMWQHFMAQKGYILFTLDNRGSLGRGKAFEEVIHRQLGATEMLDQMAGIEYLKDQTFVDADRIGIHGWSYGGYMTISLMTHYPDIFKAGVAGGPVIDWNLYETMYGERYMDRPEQNKEGYSKTSLLNQTQNLKNKLLIIHGAMDSTVILQHSVRFVDKCIDENVPLDFFIYTGHPHNVRGKNRVHLMDKVSRYFFDNL